MLVMGSREQVFDKGMIDPECRNMLQPDAKDGCFANTAYMGPVDILGELCNCKLSSLARCDIRTQRLGIKSARRNILQFDESCRSTAGQLVS